MERKISTKSIGEYMEIDIDYVSGDKPSCIDEMIDNLQEAKSIGATHLEINIFGCTFIEIHPVKMIIENDEAYAQRMQYEENQRIHAENARRAKEKALYEDLKLKYGD